MSASCQYPTGLGEKCKHIFALTHYVNIEDGHSKTSDHCEWSALKISKAGKDLYSKGKRIEELFPPKNPPASFIMTNNIPDFQVPSLFSIMYNEEKKTECERIVVTVINDLLENVFKSLEFEKYAFLVNNILDNQKKEKLTFNFNFENQVHITFYENNINITNIQFSYIFQSTIQQSNSTIWFSERSSRLTARRAHMVKIRLKNVEKLVNDLIIQKPMYGRGLTNVKYGT